LTKTGRKTRKQISETNLEAWKTGAPLFLVLLPTEVVRIEMGLRRRDSYEMGNWRSGMR